MKRILIVEDDPVARTVYKRFLEANSFVVGVATDGAKALEQMETFQPDALLLDLMMPNVNGIEVLHTLRVQDAFRQLPVIVLTNAWVPALIDQAVDAGADRVLDKSKATHAEILGHLHILLKDSPETPTASA